MSSYEGTTHGDRMVLTDERIDWYKANATAAAEVMIPGTKGHMLATEAVPRLIAEVVMLRSALGLVCSHPRRVRGGMCIYCGATEETPDGR